MLDLCRISISTREAKRQFQHAHVCLHRAITQLLRHLFVLTKTCSCHSVLLCKKLNDAKPESSREVDPEVGLRLEAFGRVYGQLKLGDVRKDFGVLGLDA